MSRAGSDGLGQGELGLLAELSEAFALTLDVERTLEQAVQRIARHMHAEAASVFMRSADGQRLVCRACVGPVDIRGMELPLDGGIVGRTFSRNRPELVRDARADQHFCADIDRLSGFQTRSVLCAPLSTARGVIGVIQVLNKQGGALFDAHDLDVLRLLAAPTALALANATLAAELVEQNRIRRELALARRLQRSLLPARPRRPWPVLAVNLPAREISGDFYDYFERPDGSIGFAIGDVSGKGLDAAMLMARAASLLRWAGKDGLDPGRWLARANDELCGTVSGGMFVCAAVGWYAPLSGELRWSSAGFPPALWFEPDGGMQEILADGPPLGILPGLEYPEQVRWLGRGSLYLYSDGVTDARPAGGSGIGVEGLIERIARLCELPPQRRLRRLLGELRALELPDDTTLLLIEAPESAARPLLDIEFEADPERLGELRRALHAALEDQPLDPELRRQLVLAVHEACCNVIRHGYGGSCKGRIGLCVERYEDALEFRLRDDAPRVDPARIRPRDLADCRPGGLGINFIDEIMDAWGFCAPNGDRGNCLWMRKCLHPAHLESARS